MNEIEKEKIEKLAYDKVLISALRKLFESEVFSENILNEIDKDASDELVGQKMKAIKVACEIIDNVFKEIETYKKQVEQIEEPKRSFK